MSPEEEEAGRYADSAITATARANRAELGRLYLNFGAGARWQRVGDYVDMHFTKSSRELDMQGNQKLGIY
ncbi:MAG: hypothetical protein QOJ42_3983, partial [Acidobacteriaceae bacterium]|nr:hypothetical protein [Acidobacteriaceae bacterium]